MDFMAQTLPCPKCGRRLQACGELTIGAEVFACYQCDECLVTVEMFGERHEAALSFCVGADGKAFDPAAPDGKLALS